MSIIWRSSSPLEWNNTAVSILYVTTLENLIIEFDMFEKQIEKTISGKLAEITKIVEEKITNVNDTYTNIGKTPSEKSIE